MKSSVGHRPDVFDAGITAVRFFSGTVALNGTEEKTGILEVAWTIQGLEHSNTKKLTFRDLHDQNAKHCLVIICNIHGEQIL